MTVYSAVIQWLFFRFIILMCKEDHTEEKENEKNGTNKNNAQSNGH